jgi:hypothetical protein
MNTFVRRTPGSGSPLAAVAIALLGTLIAGCGVSRPGGGPNAWREAIERVDSAIEQGDGPGAARAWTDAHAAALRSRRWEALVETGDAALRIAEVGAASAPPPPRVRELYLAALFRARLEGSLDGALRVADAFAGLGDGEVVEECLVLAERLARGPEDRTHVAAERERLGRGTAALARVVGSVGPAESRP